MNDIKKKELELRGMKNRINENEFYKKIEILKDAKLRARKAFYKWNSTIEININK